MDGPAPREIPVALAPEVAGRVRLGIVHAAPVVVGPSSGELLAALDGEAARLRERWSGVAPASIEPLAWARELYRAFGVDPTRNRPSSESLLRRAVRGKPMPRILNAVDVCNLCSLRFLLPLGLYDADAIRPPAVVRRGRPGESFAGIRKDEVHLEGRLLLADERGPFGNPTSDSLRTSVGPATSRLMLVVFAPASYPPDRLARDVDFAGEAMRRHLGSAVAAVATREAALA